MKFKIPADHPRIESLRTREKLVEAYETGVVASAGLIAHGRGEALDYLLGEQTTAPAFNSIEAAAAAMLCAKNPVISVNGNAAALAAEEIVELAETVGAKVEVNLFYRTAEREAAVKDALVKAGAKLVLGVDEEASTHILEIGSERRIVDSEGILIADVVLVPLEDGDRTEALAKMGKTVVAIDLNPLSRTAQKASITIVDNIVRAMPLLVETARALKNGSREKLEETLRAFDNSKNLGKCIAIIRERLSKLAVQGRFLDYEKVKDYSGN